MKLFRSWTIASAVLVLVVPTTLAAGGATGLARSETTAADNIEAASVRLQDLAVAEGALGLYEDESGYVVVIPSSRTDITPSTLSGAGLPVRLETVTVDVKTIDRISADLEALHSTVPGSYGFGFDPRSGQMLIEAEAPESAFASVEAAYPGLVSYHAGKWALASWDNDAPPHWGGAWVQGGGKGCTSGFAIEDNNGHRHMATAGHCFNPNVSTNMGTAWRPVDGYPLYDFEFLTGHTYAGYIYDTGTHARPVKNGTNPGIGNQYCTTGRGSGFVCNWTIQRLNQTMCYGTNGECYHSLAAMNRPGGAPVQGGDSGGPLWYKYSDGKAGVRGVISGYFWDITTFQWLSYVTQYDQVAQFYVMHAVVP